MEPDVPPQVKMAIGKLAGDLAHGGKLMVATYDKEGSARFKAPGSNDFGSTEHAGKTRMDRGAGCPLNMAKKDHGAIGAFKSIIVQV